MPRYDRYTTDLIQLLQDTQRRAARTAALEMTPALLLEAFFRGTSSLLRRVLDTNAVEVAVVADPVESAAMGPAVPVALAADLRRDLHEAEVSTAGDVTVWHVLAAVLPEARLQLERLLRRRDGGAFTGSLELPAFDALPASATPPHSVFPALPPLGGPLATHGRDLSMESPDHPFIGRERETNELIAVLLKYFKPNAVLLGDAGVGKTAIVRGLAQRIRMGGVPAALSGKRIVELQVGTLVAGTSYRGQFEERLNAIVAQAESDPSIILFIDEIHMLVGAGVNTGDQGDAADILKPALARGRLRVIGATTWGEYYESIEGDPALKRRFQEIRVDEPSDEAVAAILAAAMPRLLLHHRLEAGAEISPLIIALCRSELPSRRFPDKALDVLDRACANASLAGAKRLEAGHVRGVIASLAGIAFTTDSPEFDERLASLEERLGRQVLRQGDAIRTVARIVRLCKRRHDMRTQRPDGVFLFVGKSGVGKTALATALAETLLGSADAVIRLDMTGFTEPESVATLLGSPPGYRDSGEEPVWLEQLRKTPSAVLLLDELEKAHLEVMRVFLRAFDEGRITDARGNEHSLANVTVIATSNVEVDTTSVGFVTEPGDQPDRWAWIEGLQEHFPREFLNRFDEIVPFQALTVGDLGIILREKMVRQAEDRMLADFNVRLRITDAGIRRVARLADVEHFGVRELERVFRDEVLVPAIDAAHAARAASPASRGVVVVDRAAGGGLTVSFEPSGT